MNVSLLPPDIEPLLRQGLAELKLDADALAPPLLTYLALLMRWKSTYNLTCSTE